MAPASPAAATTTPSGACAEVATSSAASASGWATAVTMSTGAGPIRSAMRPPTGLSAAPARAKALPASAAAVYRPVASWTSSRSASGVMPMPRRETSPPTSRSGAPGSRQTARYWRSAVTAHPRLVTSGSFTDPNGGLVGYQRVLHQRAPTGIGERPSGDASGSAHVLDRAGGPGHLLQPGDALLHRRVRGEQRSPGHAPGTGCRSSGGRCWSAGPRPAAAAPGYRGGSCAARWPGPAGRRSAWRRTASAWYSRLRLIASWMTDGGERAEDQHEAGTPRMPGRRRRPSGRSG